MRRFSSLIRWSLIGAALSVCVALVGCLPEDSSGGGSSTTTDDNGIPVLDGLWVGTTDETQASSSSATAEELAAHLFFMDTQVYLLRENQALSGTYVQDGLGGVILELNVFEYAEPDTDNLFFVGTDSNSTLTINALLATDVNLVGSYANNQRDGEVNVTLDEDRDRDVQLKDLIGTWTTTDSETYFNSEGRFLGYDTSNSCRWEGRVIPQTSQILSLTIQRENCDEFNDDATGIAITDGEGTLHFMSERDREFLWMRFTPPTATTTDTSTDTTTDTTDTTTDTTETAGAPAPNAN